MRHLKSNPSRVELPRPVSFGAGAKGQIVVREIIWVGTKRGSIREHARTKIKVDAGTGTYVILSGGGNRLVSWFGFSTGIFPRPTGTEDAREIVLHVKGKAEGAKTVQV